MKAEINEEPNSLKLFSNVFIDWLQGLIKHDFLDINRFFLNTHDFKSLCKEKGFILIFIVFIDQ